MDLLLQKYNDYIRLVGCTAIYQLENGLSVEYTYRKENFVHLLGLHKLQDILLISMFNDKNNLKINTKTVIRNIKKGKFNDSMVKNSIYFPKIKERYDSFTYDNLTKVVLLPGDHAIYEQKPEECGKIVKEFIDCLGG